MQIIENSKVKEKLYIEKLENGLTIMIIPKKGVQKKYVIWGTNYGSNDSKFVVPGETQETEVPKGVAHFLEHKMFEQESGVNSLDTLTALGVDANAYTTNGHTAYLFECTKNFDEALDELLNYIQNPYFTDQNVEKEKGIIEQEINMYDDDAESKLYINAMKAMYKENPIRIDVAGTVDSIKNISKEILYDTYNNFYVPSNMVIVVSGDFEPEKIFNQIKNKIKIENKIPAKRIETQEPLEINQKEIDENMEITVPIFIIGFKVNSEDKEKLKRSIAIEIILEIIIGPSSKLYEELYDNGEIFSGIIATFEWSKNYAHILIQGKSNNINKVEERLIKRIKELKENGLQEKEFERAKRKIYGNYVRDFNEVGPIALLFASNYFRGINPFEYVENYKIISKEYTENILKEVFDEKNMIKSSINPY